MGYEVVESSSWDTDFFRKFSRLKNDLHLTIPGYIAETESDLKEFFAEPSPFPRLNSWKTWMVLKDGVPVARSGLSVPKYWEKKHFACLGFYEARPDLDLVQLKLMKNAWVMFCKEHSIPEIRVPLQGGFFGSYRAMVNSIGPAFYGEPDTLEHYLSQWASLGFTVTNSWQSFVVDIEEMKENCRQLLNHFYGQTKVPGVKVRNMSHQDWDGELLKLRKMFLDSYSYMPEYMPISEEEFLWFYRPLKKILRTDLSYIAEDKGAPFAFLIGYYDPLKILIEHQGSRLPKPLKNLIAYLRLKKPSGPLVIPYTGKTSAADEFKGIGAYLCLLMLEQMPRRDKECIFAYMAKGSPAFRTMKPGTYRPIANYNVYSLKISE